MLLSTSSSASFFKSVRAVLSSHLNTPALIRHHMWLDAHPGSSACACFSCGKHPKRQKLELEYNTQPMPQHNHRTAGNTTNMMTNSLKSWYRIWKHAFQFWAIPIIVVVKSDRSLTKETTTPQGTSEAQRSLICQSYVVLNPLSDKDKRSQKHYLIEPPRPDRFINNQRHSHQRGNRQRMTQRCAAAVGDIFFKSCALITDVAFLAWPRFPGNDWL